MLFQNTVFIGIDPTSGSKPFTLAALDKDLTLLALSQGEFNDILAYVGGQQSAVVGVNAPRRPNQGLMDQEEFRQEQNPVPNPGRWTSFRVLEYQLFQKNIRIPRTAGARENCPGWMQSGFKVYQRLKNFGFTDYIGEKEPQKMLEVYPHAVYTALLERIPFLKNTLEGRLQRQLVLHAQGMNVPDPMSIFEEITRYKILQGILPLNALYSVEELEALAAAFAAWKAALYPDQVVRMGDPDEGELVLPVNKLRDQYA